MAINYVRIYNNLVVEIGVADELPPDCVAIESDTAVSLGLEWEDGTLKEREPSIRAIARALVLIIKANEQLTVPPKALAIFQRLKSTWGGS